LNGLTPPDDPSGLTVRELVNRFLTAKTALIRSGELAETTFGTYHTTCGRLVAVLGDNRLVADLQPVDFQHLREKLAEGRGPAALGHKIAITRMVLKFAWDSGFLERPVRYGQSFNPPSRKTMRIERAKRGEKMFEPLELRTILEAANVPMRAFVLLGVNCAFGASDIAKLPKSAVDLAGGWIVFPRGKTGIKRRCPLWAETATAIKAAIAQRPDAKIKVDDALVFLTADGKRWLRLRRGEGREWATANDILGREFSKLLSALGLTRDGRGFYTLRHVFRTIADEAGDQPAAGAIMGHHDNSMAAAYRERISDARLQAVVDHVRAWLFPA
jgi:integrase